MKRRLAPIGNFGRGQGGAIKRCTLALALILVLAACGDRSEEPQARATWDGSLWDAAQWQ